MRNKTPTKEKAGEDRDVLLINHSFAEEIIKKYSSRESYYFDSDLLIFYREQVQSQQEASSAYYTELALKVLFMFRNYQQSGQPMSLNWNLVNQVILKQAGAVSMKMEQIVKPVLRELEAAGRRQRPEEGSSAGRISGRFDGQRQRIGGGSEAAVPGSGTGGLSRASTGAAGRGEADDGAGTGGTGMIGRAGVTGAAKRTGPGEGMAGVDGSESGKEDGTGILNRINGMDTRSEELVFLDVRKGRGGGDEVPPQPEYQRRGSGKTQDGSGNYADETETIRYRAGQDRADPDRSGRQQEENRGNQQAGNSGNQRDGNSEKQQAGNSGNQRDEDSRKQQDGIRGMRQDADRRVSRWDRQLTELVKEGWLTREESERLNRLLAGSQARRSMDRMFQPVDRIRRQVAPMGQTADQGKTADGIQWQTGEMGQLTGREQSADGKEQAGYRKEPAVGIPQTEGRPGMGRITGQPLGQFWRLGEESLISEEEYGSEMGQLPKRQLEQRKGSWEERRSAGDGSGQSEKQGRTGNQPAEGGQLKEYNRMESRSAGSERPEERSRMGNQSAGGRQPEERSQTGNQYVEGRQPEERSRTGNQSAGSRQPEERSRTGNQSVEGGQPEERGRTGNQSAGGGQAEGHSRTENRIYGSEEAQQRIGYIGQMLESGPMTGTEKEGLRNYIRETIRIIDIEKPEDQRQRGQGELSSEALRISESVRRAIAQLDEGAGQNGSGTGVRLLNGIGLSRIRLQSLRQRETDIAREAAQRLVNHLTGEESREVWQSLWQLPELAVYRGRTEEKTEEGARESLRRFARNEPRLLFQVIRKTLESPAGGREEQQLRTIFQKYESRVYREIRLQRETRRYSVRETQERTQAFINFLRAPRVLEAVRNQLEESRGREAGNQAREVVAQVRQVFGHEAAGKVEQYVMAREETAGHSVARGAAVAVDETINSVLNSYYRTGKLEDLAVSMGPGSELYLRNRMRERVHQPSSEGVRSIRRNLDLVMTLIRRYEWQGQREQAALRLRRSIGSRAAARLLRGAGPGGRAGAEDGRVFGPLNRNPEEIFRTSAWASEIAEETWVQDRGAVFPGTAEEPAAAFPTAFRTRATAPGRVSGNRDMAPGRASGNRDMTSGRVSGNQDMALGRASGTRDMTSGRASGTRNITPEAAFRNPEMTTAATAPVPWEEAQTWFLQKKRVQESRLEETRRQIISLQEKVEIQEKLVAELKRKGNQPPVSGQTEINRVARQVMKKMEDELRLEKMRRGLL